MKTLLHPLLAVAFSATALAAGPLLPPAAPGSPAADMPSLTEIQKAAYQGRTPIATSTSTVTISQPGSYILTGNITVGATDGIIINASDVTLDLNGFTIATTSTTTGAYRGIWLAGKNITIRNGRIKSSFLNNASVLEGGGFSAGIEGDFNTPGLCTHILCEDLQITGCQVGISLYYSDGNFTARRCSVHHGQSGIILANSSQNTVQDCHITLCTGIGIRSGLVIHSNVVMNGPTPVAINATQAVGCHTAGGTTSIAHRFDMPTP